MTNTATLLICTAFGTIYEYVRREPGVFEYCSLSMMNYRSPCGDFKILNRYQNFANCMSCEKGVTHERLVIIEKHPRKSRDPNSRNPCLILVILGVSAVHRGDCKLYRSLSLSRVSSEWQRCWRSNYRRGLAIRFYVPRSSSKTARGCQPEASNSRCLDDMIVPDRSSFRARLIGEKMLLIVAVLLSGSERYAV